MQKKKKKILNTEDGKSKLFLRLFKVKWWLKKIISSFPIRCDWPNLFFLLSRRKIKWYWLSSTHLLIIFSRCALSPFTDFDFIEWELEARPGKCQIYGCTIFMNERLLRWKYASLEGEKNYWRREDRISCIELLQIVLFGGYYWLIRITF